jgi:hypothetical protein
MDIKDKWKRSFTPVVEPPPAQPPAYSTTAPTAVQASAVHRPPAEQQQQARSASPAPTVALQQASRPRAWSVDPSPGVQPRAASPEAASESAEMKGGEGMTSGVSDWSWKTASELAADSGHLTRCPTWTWSDGSRKLVEGRAAPGARASCRARVRLR